MSVRVCGGMCLQEVNEVSRSVERERNGWVKELVHPKHKIIILTFVPNPCDLYYSVEHKSCVNMYLFIYCRMFI